MKKFSIFLAIILGISMFAVTSCGSSEPAEKEFEKAVEEVAEDLEKAAEEAINSL